MMFVYHIMINMGLRILLPMILYCDNKTSYFEGGSSYSMKPKATTLTTLTTLNITT